MKILIWFKVEPPPHFDGDIILWNSFSSSRGGRIFSIPTELEKNPEQYRSLYVNFIHSIGKFKIFDKTIEEAFRFDENFSLWWMSLPYEKNYGKSEELSNSVKSIVLEEFFKKKKIRSISVSGKITKSVYGLLKAYCAEKSIEFDEIESIGSDKPPESKFRRILNSLPHFMQAIIAIVRYAELYHGIKGYRKIKNSAEGDTKFYVFDYLFHLKKSEVIQGNFESNFWTKLIDVFRDSGSRVEYNHIFTPHNETPLATSAQNLVDLFNQKHSNTEAHILFQCISFRIVFSVFFSYLLIFFRALKYKLNAEKIRTVQGGFPILVILEKEIATSLYGWVCIQNLFLYYSVKYRIQQIQKAGDCIYLQENQGWEKALVYHWKKRKLGRIIGVCHATIRFWDLRYVLPKNQMEESALSEFLPDLMAVNGDLAKDMLVNAGFPKKKLRIVEALRFLNIQNIPNKSPRKGKKKLLVFTDYLASVTGFQMNMLNGIASNYEIIIKPHPAFQFENHSFPLVKYTISNQQIDELLADADVVYSSNITSAGIEAFYLGIPVILALDPENLNLSPLVGFNDINFVNTSEQLEKLLGDQSFLKFKKRKSEIFHFDKKFSSWKSLLNLNEN